jgi:arginine-tRNA-protein transferase
MTIINTVHYPESLLPEEVDDYLSKGWYRMTQYIFSVTHWLNAETLEVDRVWWLRFHVNAIASHPSHRRILKDNAKFEVRYEPYTEISLDDLVLYERYWQHIQFDTYDTLAGCLYGEEENKNLFNSWSIGVYDDGVLIAKGIIDLGHKAVMAKVNFYHPAYAKYSLGKFLILKSLDFMREKGFEWYYPGYLLVNRPRFNYKLFLGKSSAEYYDPETETWKPYHDDLLIPEVLSDEERRLLYEVYFRFFR